MIIKSYTAPTVSSALKKIREELGGDAVILRTRECHGEIDPAVHIEVTACIDEKAARKPFLKGMETSSVEGPPGQSRTGSTVSDRDAEKIPGNLQKLEQSLNYALASGRHATGIKGISQAAGKVFYNLLDSDVTVEIARRIIQQAEARTEHDEDLETAAYHILKDDLTRVIATDIPLESGMRIAFIGPGGGGKTAVMAKVAAQLCANLKQKIKLVTLDQWKPSAVPELNAYGRWLNIPARMIEPKTQEDRDDAMLLIDTPAIDPDPEKQDELRHKLEQLRPDLILLVFSVGSRTPDLVDNVVFYEPFAPNYLAASHLDIGDRWGGLLTMAEYLNCPLAFITDSPAGHGELKAPDPEIIARRLLKMEARSHE
jgi:flagellar biosynthesis protein FlhF